MPSDPVPDRLRLENFGFNIYARVVVPIQLLVVKGMNQNYTLLSTDDRRRPTSRCRATIMQTSHDTQHQDGKFYSIGRRFSTMLISVVTVLLLLFAASAIMVNLSESEKELQNRLASTFSLARISLATSLWNLDLDVVNHFIEALFLDNSIVYANILLNVDSITPRVRSKYRDKRSRTTRSAGTSTWRP
jgi:hypothetical protein